MKEQLKAKHLIIISILLLTVLWLPAAKATHIVGGDFNMQFVGVNTYRLTLNIYFDDINGNSGAIDRQTTVHIYRKSDNAYITSVDLVLRSQNDFVNASNPLCDPTGAVLRTRVLKYYDDLVFAPQAFDDLQGYYVVYERCCRNNGITNINNPGSVGQAFYMEFPPLIVGGQRFVNSTPQLTTPFNDYVCVGRPFQLSFAATDADGDQLVYELVDPWIGNSTSAPGMIIPPPAPLPYRSAQWRPGYNTARQITGPRPLAIDPLTGMLTMTAGQPAGLMVFAMQVREFRNGQQISLTRREYQLLVRDCPPEPQPRLNVAAPGWTRQNNTLTFTTNDALRIPVDIGANLRDAPSTQVCINATALNFTPSGPLVTGATCFNFQSSTTDSRIQISIPQCTQTTTGPYVVRLIATINGCPQPITDTIYINLVVNPVPLPKPTLVTSPIRPGVKYDSMTIDRGSVLRFKSYIKDTVSTQILVRLNRYNVPGAAPVLSQTSIGQDTVGVTNDWLAECRGKSARIIYEVIGRTTVCNQVQADTNYLIVKVREVNFNAPQAYTSLSPQPKKFDSVFVEAGQVVSFTAFGLDTARRIATLRAVGSGFPEASMNQVFALDSSLIGTPSLLINYRTSCKNIGNWSRIALPVVNYGCDTNGTDSAFVFISAFTPPDDLPQIRTDLKPTRIFYDTVKLKVGEVARFNATGQSTNQLETTVSQTGIGFVDPLLNGPLATISGFGQATLPVTFVATCDYINLSTAGTFKFRVKNDPCRVDRFDSLYVTFIVEDLNKAPEVVADLIEPQPERIASGLKAFIRQVYVRDRLLLKTTVTNPDSSLVRVQYKGINFDLRRLGLSDQIISIRNQGELTTLVTPNCDLLQGKSSETFRFVIGMLDSVCAPGYKDSVMVTLEVIDSVARAVIPPNVLTPNNDGKNDEWSLTSILSPDNCQDSFEFVKVLNRYGVEVMYTEDRNFSWKPKDLPAGTYFWLIRYQNSTYKGWIQLLY